MCDLLSMAEPLPCNLTGYYCPEASYEMLPCGPNMTTSNLTLASSDLDCLCVPGTHLVDPLRTDAGCAPCILPDYYQPDEAKVSAVMRPSATFNKVLALVKA